MKYVCKGCFSDSTYFSCVNFSNNMSILQTRVNMSETKHDTTLETF